MMSGILEHVFTGNHQAVASCCKPAPVLLAVSDSLSACRHMIFPRSAARWA